MLGMSGSETRIHTRKSRFLDFARNDTICYGNWGTDAGMEWTVAAARAAVSDAGAVGYYRPSIGDSGYGAGAFGQCVRASDLGNARG